MFTATTTCQAGVISIQEAIEQRVTAMAGLEMHDLQAEIERMSTTLRQNMSLETAVRSVSKNMNVTPAFASVLQDLVHPPLRTRSRDHSQHFLGMVAMQSGKAGPEYDGLNSATGMINGMLTEVVHKIDERHRVCKKLFAEKCSIMEFSRQDIEELNAEGAGAEANVLFCEGEITRIEEIELPKLDAELKDNRQTCSEKLHSLNTVKNTVESDIQVISDVLNLTDCDFSKSSSLLQCTDCRGNTTVKFHDQAVEQKLSMIKSESVRHQLRQTLKMIAASGDKKEEPEMTGMTNPCDGIKYDDAGVTPEGGACSIVSNVMCKELFEKFLIVQVGMSEMLAETKEAMQQTSDDCSTFEKNVNAEIAQRNTMLLQHQSELAYAMQTVQRTGLLAGQKKIERENMEKLMLHNRDECSTDLRHLEAEKCQLGKIRSEMFLRLSTNKDKAMFVDCEVEEWMPSECSASCGGGQQTLTREIKTSPMNGGVPCPLLKAVQECNMHKCPVDCVESPWTAWSSCSAGCDGGVKLRTREIEVHPKDLGKPCAAITENVPCAVQSCDTDCTLADWSKWSPCSKACDSGHKHRIRVELTPQTGAGTCPDPWEDERLMEEVCNTGACPIINEKVVATCNKTADIVLLLDGSGSIKDAFADELVFASNFAKGFEKQDTNFSVILFSGPYTWGQFDYCVEGSDLSKEELKNTCGIQMVQHFSDSLTTQTTLSELTYPSGSTYTSGALKLADAELKFARPEAEKIVVIFTDGVPIDKKKTKEAAMILKDQGYRIMVVPIEGFGLDDKGAELLRDVASPNKDDNTLILEDWHDLAEITQASTLVEDACR
jgi:hypothetical protein